MDASYLDMTIGIILHTNPKLTHVTKTMQIGADTGTLLEFRCFNKKAWSFGHWEMIGKMDLTKSIACIHDTKSMYSCYQFNAFWSSIIPLGQQASFTAHMQIHFTQHRLSDRLTRPSRFSHETTKHWEWPGDIAINTYWPKFSYSLITHWNPT